MIRMRGDAIVPFLALHLLLPTELRAQPTHFDIDINELDRQPAAAPEKPGKKKATRRKAAPHAKRGKGEPSDREQPESRSRTGSSPGGVVSGVAQPWEPPPPVLAPALPISAAQGGDVTWLCAVTASDPGGIVDAFLNALSISWCRNRIIGSGRSAAIPFSIRVDRYFEYKGGRYVVSMGEGDTYRCTLMRLLEDAGYRVLKVSVKDDFRAIGEKLLILLGIVPEFGRHALPGERELAGFVVQQEGSGGRRVVITAEAVAADKPWVLGPGCGAR